MIKHRFKNIEIWKRSMVFVEQVYSITANFPKHEQFGLTSQINRCAISIPSNIAEGSGRSTDKDFANFLRIALSSSFELETQLILSKNLKYINDEEFNKTVEELIEIQKMIIGFSKRLTAKV